MLGLGLSLPAVALRRETAGPSTPDSVTFGANTLAGEGGVDVGNATNIDAGNTGGHWTITAGLLVPTAAGVSAGFSGAPYTLELDNGATLTVSIAPDTVSIRGTAEFIAIIANEAHINGRTVQYRGDATYDKINNYNSPRLSLLSNRVVFEPDRPNPNPIRFFNDQGNEPTGNYTFRNAVFYAPQELDDHNFVAPFAAIGPYQMLNVSGENVIVEGCKFYSDLIPSRDGGLLVSTHTGVNLGGSNNIFRNNEIHNVSAGLRLGGDGNVVENNHIYNVFSDFIQISHTSANNFIIRNNDMGGTIGVVGILHSDGIQFQGQGTNGVIEGNVIYPGDINTRLLSSVPDPRPDRIEVSGSVTLGESVHCGNVVEMTADNTVITLPANPGLGDSYWMLPKPPAGVSFNNITVVANSGQTHGDNLLPRLLDKNAANDGTFMVYWDGSQWQTLYGVRAGFMIMTAGTRELSAAFDERIVFCDASDGDIHLTLPPIADAPYGINVMRRDGSANTVTVVPNPADAMAHTDGAAAASVTITRDRSYSIRNVSNDTNWTINPGGKVDLQGIFGNAFYEGPPGARVLLPHSNIRVRGNVIHTSMGHGFRLEHDVTGLVIENNSFIGHIPRDPADQNGDGRIDRLDGFMPGHPFIRMHPDASQDTESRIQRNVTTGSVQTTDGDAESTLPAFEYGNIGLNVQDAVADNPYGTVFATPPAAIAPESKAEAIQSALAQPGGPLDGTFIGAVGTTDENGFWDFTAGQMNPAAPDSTIASTPSGWNPQWVRVASGEGVGEIDVILDFACYSNPPLTSIEVQFDNGDWETLPGATERGTFTANLPAGGTEYTLTGIRGVNSEGVGEATTVSLTAFSGTSRLDYTKAHFPTSYSAPQWDAESVHVDGEVLAPSAQVRADTDRGDWSVPSGATDVTLVVDLYAIGGVTERVTLEARSFGANAALSLLTVNTGTQEVEKDAGVVGDAVPLGDGGLRAFVSIPVTPGERLIVNCPRNAEPDTRFRNPAVIFQALDATQVAALDVEPESILPPSLVTTDYNDADWDTTGQTIDGDGWLIAPSSNVRSDTNSASWSVTETGIHTAVVDIRQNVTGPTSGYASVSIWNVTSGTNATPSINLLGGNDIITSVEVDRGCHDFGNGIVRFWVKINAEAGDRIILGLPRTEESGYDFANPGFYAADLHPDNDIPNL